VGNNVWDPQKGRWVDTDTGNEYINGVWTNPQGGTYNPQTGQWSPTAASSTRRTGGDDGYYAQGAQLGAQQGQIAARQGVVQAGYGALQAGYATNAAQQGALGARMGTLGAQRGVLQAQQGTFGPAAAVISANQGVNAAQGALINANRSYMQQRVGENQLQSGEFEAGLAAKNNVADQAAVAQARRFYAVKDARARSFGMAPEAEVSVPVGFKGRLGIGLRAAPTTQAEDVERTNKENQTRRGFKLEGAQLAVQLAGTNVDAARLKAAEVGLTLDQAQLVVQQAQNAAGFAGNAEDVANVGVSRARLNEDQAQLGVRAAGLREDEASIASNQADLNARIASRAPFPGAEKWTDPFTGRSEWMTPSEVDQRKYQYELDLSHDRIPDQFELASARSRGGPLGEAANGGLGTGGPRDEYSGFSAQQLLNMYVPTDAYRLPFGGNENMANPVEEALVRLLLRNKTATTEEMARRQARVFIDTEMNQRAAAAARANRPGGEGEGEKNR
jgi:hypothetical protein